MIYQYVCKFYLNASHFIYIADKKGAPHSHCFEFVIDIGTKDESSFVSFTEIEKSIETILQPYQEQLLNDVAPFNELNPTLENIAGYFESVFIKELSKKRWVLLTLEVSETPTRSYLISVAEDIAVQKVKQGLTVEKHEVGAMPIMVERLTNTVDSVKIQESKTDSIIAVNSLNRPKKKYVSLPQEDKDNRVFVNILDKKTGKYYKVYKKQTLSKTDYDWEIPDELMHFDYERRPPK